MTEPKHDPYLWKLRFKEGQQGRLEGTKNPYQPDTLDAKAWQAGWEHQLEKDYSDD